MICTINYKERLW